MRHHVAFALVVLVSCLARVPFVSEVAFADEPPLQLPWPTGQVHNINGGFSYGCGSTHSGSDVYGIDFTLSSGSDVAATAAGTVLDTGDQGSLGYGRYILLAHANGFTSRYAHLQSFTVAIGQAVHQGQLIAKSGNTGNSDGAHLHWVVYQNGNAYRPEPLSWYQGFGAYGVCGTNPSPYFVSKPPANTDYNGNGCADIMARESPSGLLRMYPGPCTAGYAGSGVIYGGFPIADYDQLFGAGGFSPDGCVDVGARNHSSGTSPLLMYQGVYAPWCNTPGFASGYGIGSYWNGFSLMFSPRDMSGDGCTDVIARWGTQLLLYAGQVDGSGNCAGFPLTAYTVLPLVGWEYFSFIMGVGDFTGDGCFDLFGIYVLAAGGQPLVYPGDCNRSYSSGLGIDGGWNGFDRVWSPGDYDNDGCGDVIARQTNGTLCFTKAVATSRPASTGRRGCRCR